MKRDAFLVARCTRSSFSLPIQQFGCEGHTFVTCKATLEKESLSSFIPSTLQKLASDRLTKNFCPISSVPGFAPSDTHNERTSQIVRWQSLFAGLRSV
jgi:hypothetical protein